MDKKLKITFLGTGSTLGVPVIGCHCAVCSSKEKNNTRRRSCFLIEQDGKIFILDPGPDTRFQLLDYPIKSLDGVIITHCHHDHIGGYDDLRIFATRQGKAIPTLIHEKNTDELIKRCGYLFNSNYTAFFLSTLNEYKGSGIFQGLPYRYITFIQNGMSVTGFIFKDIAFVSDIQVVDASLIKELRGIKTLIVSCVVKQSGTHKSHLNLEEIKYLKEQTGAANVIITHMGHDIDFKKVSSELESGFTLSYDGFVLED